MTQMMITVSLLLTVTLVSSGCGYKVVSINENFDGFMQYKKPKKVKLTIHRKCKVGYVKKDCVYVEDLKPLLVRVKKLENIVDNYSQDIKDYEGLK